MTLKDQKIQTEAGETSTATVDKLNDEAWELNRSQPNKALELAKSALDQAQALEYQKGEAHALKTLGASSLWLSDLESALTYCFDARNKFKELGDQKEEVDVLYLLAASFFYLGDYDTDLEYGMKCLELSKEAGYIKGQADALNMMGTVYYTIGDNENALTHLKEGLEYAKRSGDDLIQARLLDGIATAYNNLKEYDQAIEYSKECLDIARNANFQQSLSYVHLALGYSYSKIGEFDKALEEYEESLRIRREIGFKAGEAITLTNIGKLFLENDRTEKAKEYLDEALRIANETNAKDTISNAHKLLAKTHEALGDYDEFAQHLKTCYDLKEAIQSEKAILKSKSLGLQYQKDKSEKEKEIYRLRNIELKKKQEELHSYQQDIETLGEIGREITATLDLDELLMTIYEKVNVLMDAPGFLIGLFDEERNMIDVQLSIEHGEKCEGFHYDLDNDKDQLPVISAKDKKEVFINDFQNEILEHSSKVPDPIVGKSPSSVISLPLFIKNRTLGVIYVESYQKEAYSEHDLHLLRSLASYVSTALDNAAAYESLNRTKTEIEKKQEELERSYQDLTLLSEIGQKITSCLSVESILSTVYENVNKLMDAPCFGIGMIDEEGSKLNFPGFIEKGEKLPEGNASIDDKRPGAYCFRNQEVVMINDREKELQKYSDAEIDPVLGDAPESILYVPMNSHDSKMGVITVQSFKKNAYSDHHIDILKNIAIYSAIALQNANLYQNLEEKVKNRTQEVVEQKEAIEQAYNNNRLLSEIGQQITSNLEFEKIFRELHDNVNKLMKADCFGVRIYHPDKNAIEYKYEIESGEKGEPVFVSMEDDDNYSVWCVKNKKEILLNDNLNEYHHYVNEIRVPSGEMPHSLIFYPMILGDRILGVITVQCFEKHAYTNYHLDMLKSLASYTAIALDNANLYENLEEKVKGRTQEVVEQKEIIEEKNKHITDSVKYAKRIQEAILPSDRLLGESLPEHFIFFKPKDIVSGDFYWAGVHEEKLVFGVFDCTGHGVPGAFMSMLGNNALNLAVKEKGLTDPGEVLTHLDQQISNTLEYNDEDTNVRDGMDAAICTWDPNNKELSFAGAFNPLYLLKNGAVEEIKASRNSIGMKSVATRNAVFETRKMPIEEGTCVYMFSDGYADQFGGPNGKKFKYERLKGLLKEGKDLSLKDQKAKLYHALREWQGDHDQVDDICILGAKLL